MARQIELDYDKEELVRVSHVLSALASLREEEVLSTCRDILEDVFSDSAEYVVIGVLLAARGPLCLREIAAKSDRGKRSVLPNGNIRLVIERLASTGMVVNRGTTERPRYSLDRSDSRVRVLAKMYGPLRFS